MAEDHAGEKTELPTARKREEARERGTVAKSQDLATAVLLLTAFVLIYFTAGMMIEGFSDVSDRSFEAVGEERLDFEQVIAIGTDSLKFLILITLPLAIAIVVMALAVNLAQVGFLVTFKPLAPDPNRVNPWKGLARIFSKRGLMRFVFGLLKLAIVGGVLWFGYSQLLSPRNEGSLYALIHTDDVRQSISLFISTVFALGMKAAAALLVLAILDLSFQRWQHEKDLMMTKQEVREEMKRMEGDPKLKEQRRRIQQKLALQRMMQDVPTADVVITNPTHFACAIRYVEGEMGAPRLVAKGQDHVAHRIREMAISHGIPVVEEPPLARWIYDVTEVGEEVPPDLYQPIAEVLAYVYRLRRGTTSAST